MKRLTILGGGTGTFVVLSGLKEYPYNLSAIIAMTDSGGSTGRLRDQLGVLPPGDLRQSLVALSQASLLWRRLFNYRFDTGDLSGHNFGNIFLSVLEKLTSNYSSVIKTAEYILQTRGHVLPVTFDKVHLKAQYSNGQTITGESLIDTNQDRDARIVKISLKPAAKGNPEAIKAIKRADFLIIGPGDLYTSIIPILLVKGIKQAVKSSRAKIIYIVNLMTKLGQTTNYTANDHCQVLIKYLGRTPDYYLINNGKIPQSILKWYKKHNEKAVIDDLQIDDKKVIRTDLISQKSINPVRGDRLSRSILRHSPKKIARIINYLIYA